MSLQALSNQIQTNPLSYTIIGEILKQERSQLFRKVGSDRTRENYFKLKEETFILDTREKLKVFCLFVVFVFVCLFFWGAEGELLFVFVFKEGVEVLEQAAQRLCGCTVPEGVQGQAGWGHGQPDLVLDLMVGKSAQSREAGTR